MTIQLRAVPLAVFPLLGLLGLVPLHARADDRADAFRALQAGVAGEARAAAVAHALYRDLSEAAPADPALLAYAGAAETIVGRDAPTPTDALKITLAGLARVDRAVAQLGPAHDAPGPSGMPAQLETYLVAATTYLGVPEDVFHRRADAKPLLAKALAHPALARMPPGVRAMFAQLEAQVARAEGRPADELAALRRAVALDPTGPDAADAQARIDLLSR
jgi:hypothetical protein